jgi:hypothetical protein
MRRHGRKLLCTAATIGVALTLLGGAGTGTANALPHHPPDVWSGEAIGINATNVVLKGRIDPHHQYTTYYFDLGETTSYGLSRKEPNEFWLFDGRHRVATEAFTRLRPHTTYHFRLVAHNRSGTTYGNDKTFTTARR